MSIEEVVLTTGFLVLAVIIIIKSVVIVRPHERGVVERVGKYNRTMTSGLNFVIPGFEITKKVDMRETLIDVPAQEVITKDNVNVGVDAVIYFQVIDPFKVIYNVALFELAAVKLAQTNLRNIMGDMSLDEALVSREKINLELRRILDDATDRWGVRVTRVEIQKIDPPTDIVEAMSRQMKAERTKRAAILEAEGLKRAAVLRAEGEKQATILKSEGQAQATLKLAQAEREKRTVVADGEANAIRQVYGAIHEGRPTKDLLTIKYLESLEKIANGKSTKIFMPLETTGILSSVASLGEMFRDGAKLLPPSNKPNKKNSKSSLRKAN
ncbi:MAG: SPFH domain-containing protein [Methanobacteriota archaeon]